MLEEMLLILPICESWSGAKPKMGGSGAWLGDVIVGIGLGLLYEVRNSLLKFGG